MDADCCTHSMSAAVTVSATSASRYVPNMANNVTRTVLYNNGVLA